MLLFIKKNYHYFVLFIFIFLIYYLFRNVYLFGDAINNYGFSYAISIGEIPYKDFNTVSTPLYAFVMAIGLFFSKSFIVFILEQSILVTLMFVLLNKLYGKKCYLLLIFMSLFSYLSIIPTYNFFVMFLIILLLFLEKEYSDKDLLIGFVIGLAIITKHTVGCFLILPSIIFLFKKHNRLFKRFVGLLIPCFILFLYLLFTKSLFNFLDLCFFGLFDFSKSNGNFLSVYSIFSIIILIVSVIITIRDKKEITNYYILASFSILIPLFDDCHMSIFVILFLLFLLKRINIKDSNKCIMFIVISLLYECAFFFISGNTLPVVFNTRVEPFKYTIMEKDYYDIYNKMYEVFDKNKDAHIITYSHFTIPYDVARKREIDYYIVLLKGNYGYDGTNKMISRIKEDNNSYFLIDMKYYNENARDNQIDKDILNYIINNSELISSDERFCLYLYNG